MKIGPSTRIGPDLQTEWGLYPSPIFTAPEKNSRVVEYLPPTLRGRHRFRTQPRDLSLLPSDPAALVRAPLDLVNRSRSTLVPGSTVAHGVGADEGSNTGILVMLGVFAAIGIAFASGLGAQKGTR